jgi:hypothetical protein
VKFTMCVPMWGNHNFNGKTWDLVVGLFGHPQFLNLQRILFSWRGCSNCDEAEHWMKGKFSKYHGRGILQFERKDSDLRLIEPFQFTA